MYVFTYNAYYTKSFLELIGSVTLDSIYAFVFIHLWPILWHRLRLSYSAHVLPNLVKTLPIQTPPLGQILASELAISQKASKLQVNHTLNVYFPSFIYPYFRSISFVKLQSPSSVGDKNPIVLKLNPYLQ